MSFTLKEQTRKNIEKRTGLSTEEIRRLCPKALDARIEIKIGKKLKFCVRKDSHLTI